MRTVYQARREAIVEILSTSMADELEVIPSSVGLHLSVLARSASTEVIGAIMKRASAAGVECLSLARLAIDTPPRAGLILGYGAISIEDIDEGLRILRAAFARELRSARRAASSA